MSFASKFADTKEFKHLKICECAFCEKEDVCKFTEEFSSFTLDTKDIPEYIYFERKCDYHLKKKIATLMTANQI